MTNTMLIIQVDYEKLQYKKEETKFLYMSDIPCNALARCWNLETVES